MTKVDSIASVDPSNVTGNYDFFWDTHLFHALPTEREKDERHMGLTVP
jgi:hypothetical protein